MHERVKIFTFVTGHGETLLQPPLEDHINQWLAQARGEILEITQSESKRPDGHHITVCIWYAPRDGG